MIVPEKDYAPAAGWTFNANMVPEVLFEIYSDPVTFKWKNKPN